MDRQLDGSDNNMVTMALLKEAGGGDDQDTTAQTIVKPAEEKQPNAGSVSVGTHKDRTYVGSVPKVLVPTVQGKDTKTVSLGATAGREPGGRNAPYPCSPTLVRRSYASVLKG
jgi:hypothetical protein